MKDYHNDGSNAFSLQNQFTAFVQTAIWRTRNRYIETFQRIQNIERLGLFEKGAFPTDNGESAFFYASSNLDDFWDLCDMSISIAEILRGLSPIEQQVLKLHIFDDLPFRIISDVLEKNENTIKAIYYTAIKKLTTLLGGEDKCFF